MVKDQVKFEKAKQSLIKMANYRENIPQRSGQYTLDAQKNGKGSC